MRTLLALLGFMLAVYVGLCTLLYLRQRSMIYYPQPRGLAAAEASLLLPVDGARLVITSTGAHHDNALLYFGGNAEDVSRSLDQFSASFPEHGLYLMHYRGYGGSEGEPTEQALKADALALYDYARMYHSQISVVGRSLGSGVALHVASRRPVQRLALITPYDSLLAVAERAYPIFPVAWLMEDPYLATVDAAQIDVPTLLLIAERDSIIGRPHSKHLQQAFDPAVVHAEVLEGVGHNSISEHREYWPLLRRRIASDQAQR